ncbi:hypothetical protein D3C72_2070700 [compost metagenome]
MRAVALGSVGRAQGLGVDGTDQRMAVVFVQARQLQHFGRDLQAFGNALQRLRVAAQRAGDDRVKLHAPSAPVFAQPHPLLSAARTQLVVVCSAKRGLAVAHEVEGSHAAIVCSSVDRGCLPSDDKQEVGWLSAL